MNIDEVPGKNIELLNIVTLDILALVFKGGCTIAHAGLNVSTVLCSKIHAMSFVQISNFKAYNCHSFFNHQLKHVILVLKKTVSLRRFF